MKSALLSVRLIVSVVVLLLVAVLGGCIHETRTVPLPPGAWAVPPRVVLPA